MKYELIKHKSSGLFQQLKALKDFGDIKKGDLGGLVKSEKNLSQKGTCWIYEGARVSGNARVSDNAGVYDNVQVFGNGGVYGDALVYGNARVYGNAKVYGNAHIYGNAKVYGNARVYGDARVYGNAHIYGKARIYNPINFDCDSDPWIALKDILDHKEVFPVLLGINKDLDKIMSQLLKEK